MTRTSRIALALLALFLLQRVDAQTPPATGPPTSAADRTLPADDPFGRTTPHGTVTGLFTAAERQNLDVAAEYLESALTRADRGELAHELWVVLDRRLAASLDRVSEQPEGDVTDGLINRDRIGLIESPSGNVEIFLTRVQRGTGNFIWLFSSSVLDDVPRLYDEVEPPWIERYVPGALRSPRWLSLPLYRWMGLLLLGPLLFGVAALANRAMSAWLDPLLRRFWPEPEDHKLETAGPLRLLIFALLFYGGSAIGFNLAARQFWHRVAEVLAVVALCWLGVRLADMLGALSLKRLKRGARSADVALMLLINRLLKATIVIVGVLFLLYFADVDLTAALTGLGVGGLAIGFGAQKTIENLFGGIMVISDKPINVGDFCKAGEFEGTVEDIGIRSTRIRTLDRTVVAVPNGQLALMALENYAQRDRFLFHHRVALGRPTTSEQLRGVLDQIRILLAAHPRVELASARVRFIRITGMTLELEVFAHVLEKEYPVFLAVQEGLLLAIVDIIERSGAPLPVPVAATPGVTA